MSKLIGSINGQLVEDHSETDPFISIDPPNSVECKEVEDRFTWQSGDMEFYK